MDDTQFIETLNQQCMKIEGFLSFYFYYRDLMFEWKLFIYIIPQLTLVESLSISKRKEFTMIW